MILEPRESGQYRLRKLDCQRAIRKPVLMMVQGSAAPFVDVHSLLHAILPAATAAGWEDDEVKSALEIIVADLRTMAR